MPYFYGQSHKLWLELSQPMVAKGFFIGSIVGAKRKRTTKNASAQYAGTLWAAPDRRYSPAAFAAIA